MKIKNLIKENLKSVLDEMKIPMMMEIQVEIPKDSSHGDYTSNIAMGAYRGVAIATESHVDEFNLAHPSGVFKNPVELAQELKEKLEENSIDFIEKIDVVKPGFLNFWLKEDFLIEQLKNDKSERSTGKKVMVEFTDPNPFKELHIGHLYSNIVGESFSRLFESQGNDVWRVTYQGDVGLHVAKSLWGMQAKFTSEDAGYKSMHDLEKVSLNDRVKFMGEAYALGSTKYEEDPAVKEEIHQINKQVYEIASSQAPRNDIADMYIKGRQWTLDHFQTIYERLGSDFKKNYFESVTGPAGLALVMKHLSDGVFKESNGAIIFEGETYGLHNRVFVNSLGLPTYEAKDMALPSVKYTDYAYDTSVIITADEQSAYFKVVLKALSIISPDLAAKTIHVSHGMVDVKDDQGNRVKMSSRKGNVITGEWLVDTAKEKILLAYPNMDAETAEKVAIGSVKYALLKTGVGKNIEFSFKESISFEGNSGPYLQYSYVRTQSIISKWQMAHGIWKNDKQLAISHKLEPEELLLLRTLVHFDEVVAKAADELAPSHVATYLFDLAQKFNNFYQKHTIVGSEQEAFRLGLTEKVGEVIKRGLGLLGIGVPEKM